MNTPVPRFVRIGITLRTALLAWGIALITLTVFVGVVLPLQKETFLDNLRSKAYGTSVALSEVAAGAVVNEDYSTVVDHCMETLQRDPAVEYIVFTRNDGFSLVHDRSGWNTKTLDGRWRPARRVPVSGIETLPPFNRRVFAYSQPFDYSGIDWGWIHIGLNLDAFDASIRRLYLRTAIIGAICLAFSFGISLLYARHLVGPIVKLEGVVRRVAKGDLSARAEVQQQDEIGRLANSVNAMTDALLRRDRNLKEANETLEARVQARTSELEEQVQAKERALADLAEAQQRLMEFSHQAGMAQIATGILHNVGNVLNSVNVSANLLREDFAGNPRYALLRQVCALLREHEADLAGYLTRDPRGRMIPSLLGELATELAASRAAMAVEVDGLSQNVDHIKQIVAVQQSHAKSVGVIQEFAPGDLLHDALRITQASLRRHGVGVTLEIADALPVLSTDRHEVLQILVNLVTNAVEAVKVRPAGERRLRLRLAAAPGTVTYAVEDNGMGIAPENMQRIFQHGFSTRRDGHGFGLHTGALQARRLGGQLSAASAGPDRGATFTLVLPLTPDAGTGAAI